MTAKIFATPEELIAFKNNAGDFSKLVTTSGGFDPLHVGHLRCIQETTKIAREIGGKSVIIVNGDGFLRRKKGRPFMEHSERMEIVASLQDVDFVVGWEDDSQTVEGCLELLKPAVFCKGGDRSDPSVVPEFPLCQRLGCEIRFGVGGKDKIQSSSELIALAKNDNDAYDLLFRDDKLISKERKMRLIEKPWGCEEIIVATDRYAAKILTILPGARLSKQYHEKKDETIYVVQGTLQLEIGGSASESGEIIFMSPGDVRQIEPGTIHRFSAWHNVVKLFEASTPELTDVVRVSDDYGRL